MVKHILNEHGCNWPRNNDHILPLQHQYHMNHCLKLQNSRLFLSYIFVLWNCMLFLSYIFVLWNCRTACFFYHTFLYFETAELHTFSVIHFCTLKLQNCWLFLSYIFVLWNCRLFLSYIFVLWNCRTVENYRFFFYIFPILKATFPGSIYPTALPFLYMLIQMSWRWVRLKMLSHI